MGPGPRAGPGLPLPSQPQTGTRAEVLVVSLLGAEPYAIQTWLLASLDPSIPRLAVLVPHAHAPLVVVELGRALTRSEIGGI